jgi:hypothetical protein
MRSEYKAATERQVIVPPVPPSDNQGLRLTGARAPLSMAGGAGMMIDATGLRRAAYENFVEVEPHQLVDRPTDPAPRWRDVNGVPVPECITIFRT